MNNISDYRKRFYSLLESEMGNVKPLINEQNSNKENLIRLVKSNKEKVLTHFKNLYNNPQTKIKFKNKSNVQKVLYFIPTIKIRIYWSADKSLNPKAYGWVKKTEGNVVNLNMYLLTKGDIMYNTILHEIAHLIDIHLQKLGEDTVTTSTSGFYNPEGKQDSYVYSEDETIARIQRLREMLGIGPLESEASFSQKVFQHVKNRKITFGNYKVSKDNTGQYLILSKSSTDKGILSDLWAFYSKVLLINNEKQPDIAALFANNSRIEKGYIYLDLFKMAKVNINTKAIN